MEVNPAKMRREHTALVHKMGQILRELADRIEAAVGPDGEADETELHHIANELYVNANTVATLKTVSGRLKRFQTGMN